MSCCGCQGWPASSTSAPSALAPAQYPTECSACAGWRAEIRTIVEFFRGGFPLGRAFWHWGILGGGIVSLFATLLALTLIAAGAPAWLAVLVFAAHIPWNLVLLVGVWRSAGRPGVSPAAANLARLVIFAWVVVLSLL